MWNIVYLASEQNSYVNVALLLIISLISTIEMFYTRYAIITSGDGC